jgi:hypothetical protein
VALAADGVGGQTAGLPFRIYLHFSEAEEWVTRLHSLQQNQGNWNSIRYSTLIPIERGARRIFPAEEVGGIADKFAGRRPRRSLYFFSLGVTEPSAVLSLRDQGKVGPSFMFLLQSVTDAGTLSGHCNELISAGRNPPSWVR